MRIALAFVVMLGGCQWMFGLEQVDPPVTGDGHGVDAMRSSDALQFEDCRGKLVFAEAPLLFPGFNEVATPTIRGDLQEAYDIENDLTGTNIHQWELGSNSMFAPADPADASPLDTGTEDDPSVTADGLEIAFVSTRLDGIDYLYLAERDSVDEPWGAPVLMPGLEDFVGGSLELSADGLTLYAVDGGGQMFQCERTDRGRPFALGDVVATGVLYPTISADGLELISEYNPTDTMVGLFEQVRSTKLQAFEGLTQIMLPGVPTQADLSRDNHILLTANKKFFTRSCQ